MASFIEIIYIDREDNARQTNLRLSLESDAATWAEFRRLRRYGVDIKVARFLLDYHKSNGDMADTIAIDADGFRIITHLEPLSDEAYCKIDADFWNEVRSQAA